MQINNLILTNQKEEQKMETKKILEKKTEEFIKGLNNGKHNYWLESKLFGENILVISLLHLFTFANECCTFSEVYIISEVEKPLHIHGKECYGRFVGSFRQESKDFIAKILSIKKKNRTIVIVTETGNGKKRTFQKIVK